MVADFKIQSPTDTARNILFVPFEQRDFGTMFNVVVQLPPTTTVEQGRRTLARHVEAVDSRILPFEAESLQARLVRTRGGTQFLTAAIGTGGVLALLLAASATFGLFEFATPSDARSSALDSHWALTKTVCLSWS